MFQLLGCSMFRCAYSCSSYASSSRSLSTPNSSTVSRLVVESLKSFLG
uniref:Uncharacterized protein n=1 Tax=Arundo donax TaxID=35708 RepID=A0A0A9F4Y1_ARUDO